MTNPATVHEGAPTVAGSPDGATIETLVAERRIVATDGYLEVLECGHRRTPRLLRRQMLMSDFCNATTRKCEECAA